jgi:hypothetical protein
MGFSETKWVNDLPLQFIDEVKRRIGRGRAVLDAIKSIRRDWKAGSSIPGYGTWKDYYWYSTRHDISKPSKYRFPKEWDVLTIKRGLDYYA